MQGLAAPLVARGLLQHEAKLSVLNFAVRKSPYCKQPIANKAPLLLSTGLRYVCPSCSGNALVGTGALNNSK